MSDPNQPYGAVPPPSYPPPPPGPPVGPPPGFPPPSGPPGFPRPGFTPPGGPPGKGRGLLVALGIIGALALVGVVVALVLLLTDDDGDSDADDRDATASASPTGGADPTDPTTATDSTDSTDPTDAPSTSSTDVPSPQGSSTADAVVDEPAAVVEAFMASVFNGDCATAEDLVTEAYLEEEGRCDASEIPTGFGDQVQYDVGGATVSGSTAKVPVEISFGGEKESSTVSLVQEDGHWRISDAG